MDGSRDRYFRKSSSIDRSFPDYNQNGSPMVSPKESRTSSPTVFAMSPTVKEKIMSSPGSPKFAPIPFSKINSPELVHLKPTYNSPLHARRSMYKNASAFKPVLTTSSDSDDYPIGSPMSCDQMTSSNVVDRQQSMRTNSLNRLGSDHPGEIYPTRQKFLKSLSEESRPTNNVSVIKYNRQVSVQPLSQPKHKPRKISLPAKPGVKFCTEIQIFEIKRH